MSNLKAPFRFDYVGSFLRPEPIKKARADFKDGKITADDLRKIENEEIAKLVEKQKKAGYHVITDGEFRRSYWHLDFMWGLNGIKEIELDHGYFFHGEETTHGSAEVTGKISGENHPFVEDYKFVKQFEDENTVAKQTIPAPAQFIEQMIMPFALENTSKYYDSTHKLAEDIANGYKKVIADLYDAGCRNLQLDDCSWGMLVDPRAEELFGTDKKGLKDIQELLVEINNLAIEDKPNDMTITTHVCRGNFHSTYASAGAYDSVAEVLFEKENVDAYYLEFDDERSGGFEPLAHVNGDKKVVLGLITTKSPKLENKADVIARIKEAQKYISLDRLCLSPQCGFASCEIGNKLTEEEQWAKLTLVKEIAKEVWG